MRSAQDGYERAAWWSSDGIHNRTRPVSSVSRYDVAVSQASSAYDSVCQVVSPHFSSARRTDRSLWTVATVIRVRTPEVHRRRASLPLELRRVLALDLGTREITRRGTELGRMEAHVGSLA